MEIKLEHNYLNFTTTKWDGNDFTHYGFNVFNGKVTLVFVEKMTQNGKNGNLWKRTEIYHYNRQMEEPTIPNEIQKRVIAWYKGVIIQNL